MPTIQVQAQLTSRELLKAVAKLPPRELNRFVAEVVALRARAPRLSHTESELLTKINRGLPSDLQDRYDELIGKRSEATLTEPEHDELLRLTEQVEAWDVERVELLAELARSRKTTLPALMKDLGIKPPPHA